MLMLVMRRQLWRALRLSMPACILNPGKAVLDLKASAALLFEAAEPSNFQGYKAPEPTQSSHHELLYPPASPPSNG